MKQLLLHNFIIPAMRLAEKQLYCPDISGKLYFKNWLETQEHTTGSDKVKTLYHLKYQARSPMQNWIQHPGYTLWKGCGICKDVAFLLHSFLENSHYIEAWKDLLDGHVFVVHSDFVYDFTSPHGLRKRHREFQDPIESVKCYYSNTLFIQENFKILKKYEGKIL